MKKILSAGAVVLNKEGKILVVNQHGDSWSLPKGHVEEGEDVLVAAKRETREESGLKNLVYIKTFPVYTRYRLGKNGVGEDTTELKTVHMFLFKTEEEHLQPEDPENPEARWVEKKEVVNYLTHPRDKQFIEEVVVELEKN